MSVNSNEEKPLVITPYGASVTQGSATSDPQPHPYPPHPYPLYAATLTQVSAGGDLAEMKRLEAAAEQQLADHDNVAKALQDLKAETAKLS